MQAFVENKLKGILSSRDQFEELKVFLSNKDDYTYVGVMPGLRRTGKTIMLLQAFNWLNTLGVHWNKMCYLELSGDTDMDDLRAIVFEIVDKYAIEYLFIDEISFTYGLAEGSQWLLDAITT